MRRYGCIDEFSSTVPVVLVDIIARLSSCLNIFEITETVSKERNSRYVVLVDEIPKPELRSASFLQWFSDLGFQVQWTGCKLNAKSLECYAPHS